MAEIKQITIEIIECDDKSQYIGVDIKGLHPWEIVGLCQTVMAQNLGKATGQISSQRVEENKG